MVRPANKPPERRCSFARLFVLLAALALTCLAGAMTAGLWLNLATPRFDEPALQRLEQALVSARSARNQDVIAGEVLSYAAQQFDAVVRTNSEPQLDARTNAAISRVSGSYLGRLYQAGFAIMRAEHAGKPATEWWPDVSSYLNGLETAPLLHFGAARIAHLEAAYRAAGMPAGTAQTMLGYPHNRFVQYMTPRLRSLETALADASSTQDAATCRVVRQNWLKSWVLESGPAATRLLAADLLADELEQTDEPTSAGVAADLRAWRSAYHVAAEPRPLNLLAPRHQPALCPDEYRHLMQWLTVNVVLAAASAVLALITLALFWRWLTGNVPLRRATVDSFLLVILTLVVTESLMLSDTLSEDLPRTFELAEPDMWWHLPIVVAGYTLLLVLLLGLLPARWGERSRGLTGIVSVACAALLPISIATTLSAVLAENARQQWDIARAAALTDDYTAIAGADADGFLDTLRAWQPG